MNFLTGLFENVNIFKSACLVKLNKTDWHKLLKFVTSNLREIVYIATSVFKSCQSQFS